MAWAVDAQSLQPVHISLISRELTGLACGCLCPGCGARLQAVNAGRPASDFVHAGNGSKVAARPHFRHHTVQQQPGCKSSTARQVALHLLASTDEIDLPAPKAPGSVTGVSGTVYQSTEYGVGLRSKVVSTTWLDRHAAVLHLGNGRTIAVVLVANASLETLGRVDGVIAIEGTDPAVADLDPAEVLKHIRLDGAWLRWVRHWDDASLSQAASALALEKAQDALDVLPDGLVLPVGLSPLQRSESVLHWAIKEALAGMSTLEVPGAADVVQLKDHEGSLRSRPWAVAGTRLHLKDLRLEARMGDLVPDVVCSAESKTSGLSHPALLIEVAVTHKVDRLKLRKIIDAGYACLELDATKLTTGGRVRREDLPRILSDRSCLKWLHHPAFVAAAEEAARVLKEQIDAARQAAEDRWLEGEFWRSNPPETYYAALVACLQLNWQTGLRLPVRPGWQKSRSLPVLFEKVEVDRERLIEHLALQIKGFAFEPGLMDRGGVLQILSKWTNADRSIPRPRKPLELLRRFQSHGQPHSKFITVLFAAINAGLIVLDEDHVLLQQKELQAIKSAVWKSLQQGRPEFGRPAIYDDLVCHAYPCLRPYLTEEGTDLFSKRMARSLADQEHSRWLVQQEQNRQRTLVQAEETEKRLAQQKRTQLIRKLSMGGWEPAVGHPHDLEQAQHIVRPLKCYYVSRDSVVQKAWAAREQGMSVEKFYHSLSLNDERAIREVGAVLSMAYMKL